MTTAICHKSVEVLFKSLSCILKCFGDNLTPVICDSCRNELGWIETKILWIPYSTSPSCPSISKCSIQIQPNRPSIIMWWSTSLLKFQYI